MPRFQNPYYRVFLCSILILAAIYLVNVAPQSYAFTKMKSRVIDYTKNIETKSGDLIFQHLPGPLTGMIADVTKSPYSHCGIIVKKKTGFVVLEAVGPVKETPINEWIARGAGDRFTIVRLKDPYQPAIPKIIRQAYRLSGRPYDIQYEWDDKKIYCSELIYKAVQAGSGLRLARFVRLGELAWRPYEKQIRLIAGGDLPLDRRMITPADVAASDHVHTIFSSFPARVRQGIRYDEIDLAGVWKGRYMLLQIPLPARIEVGPAGLVKKGWLGSGLTLEPNRIKRLNPQTGEFGCVYLSENNIRIKIAGRIDKSKEVVFGRWTDNAGFEGTFVLSKE